MKLYINGRRQSFRCDSKSQAAALYGRLKAEHREGKYFTKRKALPFEGIAREYVQAIDACRRRQGDDAARMHRWITAFGEQDALTISPRQIECVLMTLQAEGKQPATLVRHLAVLKATFNRAKRLGLMKENPATLVKAPKVNNILVRYLMAEQESTLIEQLPLQYRSLMTISVMPLRLTLASQRKAIRKPR